MSSDSAIDDFVGLVLRNLEKNGFPSKAVSFPLEKMYESASERGFSFNKVRDIFRQHGIETELTEDRVIFSSQKEPDNAYAMPDMAEAAQQILQNMTEEQRDQLFQMIQSMGPQELERMQQQWGSMPPEEQARLMEQMKKSGFPS